VKTIPIALAAHYALETTTVCACLKVTRTDTVVLGFTSLDRQITVDGQVYEPGFDLSEIVSTATLGVDNLELTIIPDEATVTQVDLLTGLWSNAAFEVFEVNYADPAGGINVLKRGTTGEVNIREGAGCYVVEFRGLSQALQQQVSLVTSKTCRARFADYPVAIQNARCRLNPASFTFTGTLTGVTSRQVVTDTGRTEADDYFAEGFFRFDTGDNAGYSQKVKVYAADVFTFSLPFPFDPLVGDTYTVIAGCRKRLTEDCKDKFANVLNFQGEPHLPGVDSLTKPAGSPN